LTPFDAGSTVGRDAPGRRAAVELHTMVTP
jgi:hypothetical protein